MLFHFVFFCFSWEVSCNSSCHSPECNVLSFSCFNFLSAFTNWIMVCLTISLFIFILPVVHWVPWVCGWMSYDNFGKFSDIFFSDLLFCSTLNHPFSSGIPVTSMSDFLIPTDLWCFVLSLFSFYFLSVFHFI